MKQNTVAMGAVVGYYLMTTMKKQKEKGKEGTGRGGEEVRRREEVGRKNRGGIPFKTTFSMAYFFLVPSTSQ